MTFAQRAVIACACYVLSLWALLWAVNSSPASVFPLTLIGIAVWIVAGPFALACWIIRPTSDREIQLTALVMALGMPIAFSLASF